ncbi:MAG: glycosyltransferase, partial [Bacteroidota bacterium]|nr:glycosyltransferase [Bacteroidota bacterium]
DIILSVNKNDTTYFKDKFSAVTTELISLFHENNSINILKGKGNYALYHGNLEVSENYKAAEYLIKEVFSKLKVPFIIAGKNPPAHIAELAKQYNWIQLIANPENGKMQELIREAHVHTLITFQPTGLKLKLLNTLFNGRFIIANPHMLHGTTLHNTCYMAENPSEIINTIENLFEKQFTDVDIKTRELSVKNYSNSYNIKQLTKLIFND